MSKFTEHHKLKRRSEFLAVKEKGLSWGMPFFVVSAKKSDILADKPVRIGFVVSKKVGNAVTRNRIKRVLRALVVFHLKERAFLFQAGGDYVFIGRKGAAQKGLWETLNSHMHKALLNLDRKLSGSYPRMANKEYTRERRKS